MQSFTQNNFYHLRAPRAIQLFFSLAFFTAPFFLLRRPNNDKEDDTMKLPNGYGSVIKLQGKRRRPWAVRTSYLEEQENGTVKRKKRYLAYFAKKESALAYLAELNSGALLPEHQKYADIPTFAELYEKWKKYRCSLKNRPGASAWKNYGIAFNMYAPVHDRKIVNIRARDLQECITAHSSKSRSTIGNMRAIVRGMWSYAVMNEYVENDITQHLVFEFTNPETPIHTRFTDKELALLWNSLWVVNNVDIVLIYIYTGLRPAELLEIKSKDVHLKNRYLTGGMKTEAGRNRIVPIHDAIVPLIEYRLSQNRTFLITNKYGNQYTRAVYHSSNWNTCMSRLGLNHAPHDCRYTFAALADNAGMNETCRKLIMGHALPNKAGTAFKTGGRKDVTMDIYTEKTIPELVAEINRLPSSFV